MSDPVEKISLCENCNTAFHKGIKALPRGKDGFTDNDIEEIKDGFERRPRLTPTNDKDGIITTTNCDNCGQWQTRMRFYDFYTGPIEQARTETIGGLKVKRLGKYVAVLDEDYNRDIFNTVNTETCRTVAMHDGAKDIDFVLHQLHSGDVAEEDFSGELEDEEDGGGEGDGPGFYIMPGKDPWKALGPYDADYALSDSDTLSAEIDDKAYDRFQTNQKKGLTLPTMIIEARDRLSALHGQGNVWWVDGLRKGRPVDPRQATLPFDVGLPKRVRPPLPARAPLPAPQSVSKLLTKGRQVLSSLQSGEPDTKEWGQDQALRKPATLAKVKPIKTPRPTAKAAKPAAKSDKSKVPAHIQKLKDIAARYR